MPQPFHQQLTSRSTTRELIRADKDLFIKRLYAQLGPREFWRRRLGWLAANRKWTSHARLAKYLEANGFSDLLTRKDQMIENPAANAGSDGAAQRK
jgi:hypothetical protein